MPTSKRAKGLQVNQNERQNTNSNHQVNGSSSGSNSFRNKNISGRDLNTNIIDHNSSTNDFSYRRRFDKDNNTATQKDAIKIGMSELPDIRRSGGGVGGGVGARSGGGRASSNNSRGDMHDGSSSFGASADDEIMSFFILNQDKTNDKENDLHYNNHGEEKERALNGLDNNENGTNQNGQDRLALIGSVSGKDGGDVKDLVLSMDQNDTSLEKEDNRVSGVEKSKNQSSSNNQKGLFDEEPNIDLLRQYIAVDYEITQLEDKDSLRIYHEKIEQLEQLERELDMISSEAEEVAVRSESSNHLNRLNSLSISGSPRNGEQKMDVDNSSITNSSMSTRKSWTNNNNNNSNNNQTNISSNNISSNNNNNHNNNQKTGASANKISSSDDQHSKHHSKVVDVIKKSANNTHNGDLERKIQSSRRSNNLSSYSTIEDVFNRKIILEKERDKLKKEVEIVIIECDKLQQRYKKRDEILDKLFDGRTGNGLENHLEQQLNWLLEQKHYVDQVFYAWKRAETLTSQTCDQFLKALELLRDLPKVNDEKEQEELAKNISCLLAKSREDIEQAQKYNPNVDAPFFTDNETERFDKIIEIVSSNSLSPGEYSQILTVVQFAHKRALSIKLWLEQILQTTIARDSFELAEEYKWIAIQLRKERINLIKSKLQDPPYQQMVEQIQEEVVRQQSIVDRRQQNEINRDSGVESETNDIDIEEEIYRLLEMNKSRLEAARVSTDNNNNNKSSHHNSTNNDLANNNRMSVIRGNLSNANNEDINTQRMITNGIRQHDSNGNQFSQLKVSSMAQTSGGLIAMATANSDNVSRNQHHMYLGGNNTNNIKKSQQQQRDETMRQRIQQRVKGDQQLHLTQQIVATGGATRVMPPPDEFRIKPYMIEADKNSAYSNNLSENQPPPPPPPPLPLQQGQQRQQQQQQQLPAQSTTATTNTTIMMSTNNNTIANNSAATSAATNGTTINPTPTKLKIELDEEARQSLLSK